MKLNTKHNQAGITIPQVSITLGFLALAAVVIWAIRTQPFYEEPSKTPHYVYRLVLVGESTEPVARNAEMSLPLSAKATDGSVVDLKALYDGTFVTPKLLKNADNKK